MRVTPGATDQSVYVHMSAADGTDKTDLNAEAMTAKYQRDNGPLVTITLSDLAAVDSAHSDGGVIHVQGGVYRLDLPDAAQAAGATRRRVYVTGTDAIQTKGVEDDEIAANPLLATDSRLPATGVIATKTDIPSPAGDGDIAVNHSLGHDQGTDGLRLLDANDVPVDNATVEAFLATDTTYAARKGTAYTGVDGRWIAPMMLNAGTYVFRFRKDQLVVVTDAVEVA